MRVVTNSQFIQRNRQLAQFLLMGSIGGLIFAFFYGNRVTGQNTQLAVYFQCIILPFLLGVVMFSVRMNNRWLRPPSPWDAIEEGLSKAGKEYTLYHYLMPAPHVLIGPDGIFALTTRFQDRPQKVTDDKWEASGLLVYMRQEQVGDPTTEAKENALKTQVFLRELLNDSEIVVQPLIVFTHPRANVIESGVQSIPILYAEKSGDKKDQTVRAYLKTAKKTPFPTLTKEQQAELDNLLLYAD